MDEVVAREPLGQRGEIDGRGEKEHGSQQEEVQGAGPRTPPDRHSSDSTQPALARAPTQRDGPSHHTRPPGPAALPGSGRTSDRRAYVFLAPEDTSSKSNRKSSMTGLARRRRHISTTRSCARARSLAAIVSSTYLPARTG